MRGDISMHAVIFLALGFIIFLIFMIAFKDKMSFFSVNTDSCEQKGGICIAQATECQGSVKSYSCPDKEKKHCCVPSGGWE